jgi:hypothetical protein
MFSPLIGSPHPRQLLESKSESYMDKQDRQDATGEQKSGPCCHIRLAVSL